MVLRRVEPRKVKTLLQLLQELIHRSAHEHRHKDCPGGVAGGCMYLCHSGRAHLSSVIISIIYRRKLKTVCYTLKPALCSYGSHDQPGSSFMTEQSRNQKDLFDCPEGPGMAHTGGIVSIF